MKCEHDNRKAVASLINTFDGYHDQDLLCRKCIDSHIFRQEIRNTLDRFIASLPCEQYGAVTESGEWDEMLDELLGTDTI